jgi:hypothetical protein
MYERARVRERDLGRENGHSYGWDVVPGKQALPERHALHVGDAAPEAAITPTVGHESHKIRIDFGHGTVTGGITLIFEAGVAGAPLGDDHLKALKSSATLKLNDFAMKLETTLLSGNLGTELDGIKVAIEANVLKASSDGEELSKKLLTIGVKLEGDASHWFTVDRPISVKLAGDLQIALGGKLATKLTEFAVAELEEVSAAQELEGVAGKLAEHARQLEQLEARRATAAAGELAALEGQIVERRALMMGEKEAARDIALRLAASRSYTRRALYKLEGKLVKAVARAMEKRAAQLIAKNLARIIPVLNVAMLALDAIELIQLIRMMWKHYSDEAGEGGGGDGESASARIAAAGHDGDKGKPHGDSETAPGTDARGPSTDDVMRRLSPAARSVVAEIVHKDRRGVALSPEHVQMIGMFVAHLTPSEVDLVVTTLREHASGPAARTPDEVIETIDTIARAIKNGSRVVSIDGKLRPELTPLTGPVLSPDQMPADALPEAKGPITSPNQVRTQNETAVSKSQGRSPRPAPVGAADIVQAGPPEILARWFVVDGKELVMSGEGAKWRAANVTKPIGRQERLLDLKFQATWEGVGFWELTVTFVVSKDGRQQRMPHSFCASAEGRSVSLERCAFMSVP